MLDDHWLMSPGKPMRDVVAANIRMLMEANPHLNTNAKLAQRSGASLGTVGRVRQGKVDPGVETINQIASAFGIEGWALMVEGWTPDNPPVIRGRTETERELYERLARMVEELKTPAKRD